MKKYLLPSALILVFGLGVALAQNITKAIQLSQDATGAFGVDTSNNVYFPAHVLNNATTSGFPTVSQLAGAAPTLTGSDFGGTISGGTNTTTTAFLFFGKAYAAAPSCVATSQNPATSPLAYNIVATGLNFTSQIGASIINYICTGLK